MDDVEIIVRGKGSDISTDFYEPINIPLDIYEAKLGLKSFATYNNIPNRGSEQQTQGESAG